MSHCRIIPSSKEDIPIPLLLDYLLRIADVCQATGLSRSLVYERIGERLITKPVKLEHSRVSLWPAHEIVEINRAIVAGWTDDEIRVLVTQLEAVRAHFPS